MRITDRQWGFDLKTNSRVFQLRGRVGIECKVVTLNEEGDTPAARVRIEQRAYGLLREAFGLEAKRS